MTDTQLIDRARVGKRIITKHTLRRALPLPVRCELTRRVNHEWRTIVCDDTTDVVECSRCGYQRLAKCNFDEEYS